MKIMKRIALPVLLCAFLATPAGGAEKEENSRGSAPAGLTGQGNYAALPGLVAMVGADAMTQLQDFFAAEPVTIEPFIVLSEFSTRRKISLLGATLAEQMAAVIGNEALAVRRPGAPGEHEQWLSGVLQEVDGYLRIHILAANSRGERRSYVVNVEMSEPVYRALHNYVTIQ